MSTDAKPKYKIHYFNLRGRAEIARLIMVYAGVEFEDFRFSYEEWHEKNERIPFHLYNAKTQQVPLLEIHETSGEVWYLTQSVAIARFLADRYGLTGVDKEEAAECDELVDAMCEPIAEIVMTSLDESLDAEGKRAVHDKMRFKEFPRIFGHIETRIRANGGEHLVGKQLTWADFSLQWIVRAIQFYAKPIADEFDKTYPAVMKLIKDFEKIPPIARHIQVYPVTTE